MNDGSLRQADLQVRNPQKKIGVNVDANCRYRRLWRVPTRHSPQQSFSVCIQLGWACNPADASQPLRHWTDIDRSLATAGCSIGVTMRRRQSWWHTKAFTVEEAEDTNPTLGSPMAPTNSRSPRQLKEGNTMSCKHAPAKAGSLRCQRAWNADHIHVTKALEAPECHVQRISISFISLEERHHEFATLR